MRGWISDLGFALRVMARKPQGSLMLIATLVLGISVTTAMFSVFDAVLLRPLPFVDPSRVVLLGGAGFDNFDYWNSEHTFDHIAIYYSGGANVAVQGAAVRAQITEVSPDYFSVFGAAPIVGSGFAAAAGTVSGSSRTAAAAGDDHVAILSYAFWRRNFDDRSDALGAAVRINSIPYVVMGVMPAGFAVPGESELWIPFVRGASGPSLAGGEQPALPSYMAGLVIARLRVGVTLAQARGEMEALRQRQVKSFAGTKHASTSHVGVTPYFGLLVRNYRAQLLLLFLAAAMVLLIACANSGGLLFARGAMRRKELAVRMSLGASRWRIIRQLLAESIVIATASTVLAVTLSAILIRCVRLFGPADVPRLAEASLNLRALAFAVAVSQFTGLVAGLWPAIRSSTVRILRRCNPREREARGNSQAGLGAY